MKTIHKFQLPIENDAIVIMPKGAEVIYVDAQYDVAQIWAIVDPQADTITRVFKMVGTGYTIDFDVKKWPYLGTFQLHGGQLIFHLFGLAVA